MTQKRCVRDKLIVSFMIGIYCLQLFMFWKWRLSWGGFIVLTYVYVVGAIFACLIAQPSASKDHRLSALLGSIGATIGIVIHYFIMLVIGVSIYGAQFLGIRNVAELISSVVVAVFVGAPIGVVYEVWRSGKGTLGHEKDEEVDSGATHGG